MISTGIRSYPDTVYSGARDVHPEPQKSLPPAPPFLSGTVEGGTGMSKKRNREHGLYSKCFRRFSDLTGYNSVVLWVRVSVREQKRRKNLDDQDAALRQATDRYGVDVVRVFRHVGSGWDVLDQLKAAIDFARKHDAVLVAESVDRFLRHPEFRTDTNPDVTPSEEQLEELDRVADGVVLMTLLDPNSEPHEIRSYQRARGQATKGNKGGGDQSPGHKKLRTRLTRIPRSQLRNAPCRWVCRNVGNSRSTTISTS